MRKITLTLAIVLFFISACGRTPNLGGAWKMGGPYDVGKPCTIIQNGETLTFVNQNGEKSTGKLKDNTTVIATNWEGGLEGVLSDSSARINWKNGTWWLKEK
jgi:hypothetical protein